MSQEEEIRQLISAKKFNDALSIIDKLLNNARDDVKTNLLLNKGYCLMSIRKYTEATLIYDKLLDINPDDFRALIYKFLILIKSRQYYEAKICIDKALQIINKYGDDVENYRIRAYLAEGIYYFYRHKYDDALKKFDHALTLSESGFENEKMDIMNAKAYTLSVLGRHKEAEDSIEDILKIRPDNSDYLDTQGFILYNKKKYDDALKKFEEVVKKDSTNADAWYHLGEVKFALSDYDGAIESYEEALKIEPDFAEIYNSKAVVFAAKNEYEKAIVEVKKALELDPNQADAYQNLAKITLVLERKVYSFWQFWYRPKKRLAIPLTLSFLAVLLVIHSLYFGNEITTIVNQSNNTVAEIREENITTTVKEHKVPQDHLVILGIIVLILLAPEIRTAKVGPIEMELIKEIPPLPLSNV